MIKNDEDYLIRRTYTNYGGVNMAFDLNDEELQATREMNKTAWESEIDKWSKEYLIERYKELVEIEKEHKKENGELREQNKKLEKKNKRYEKYLRDKDIEHEKVLEYIETEKEIDYIPKFKVRLLIEKYRAFGWHDKDDEYWVNRIIEGFEELLQEGDDK